METISDTVLKEMENRLQERNKQWKEKEGC
jgi:hypothetical protein